MRHKDNIIRQQASVSAQEVADRFRIHAETVRRMARAGKIPAFRTGRSWRFDLDEVEEVLRITTAE